MVATSTLVSVVIPTWNERENIVPLVKAVGRALQGLDFEVLVVDDASPDGTGALVEAESRAHPHVRLLRRPGKLGLSSAVLQGAGAAGGSIVVMMDADFSHDPIVVPLLVRQVQEGCDVALGSRYVRGAHVRGWPLYRRAGSLTFTWLARLLFRLRVHDPLSGFVAFRREVLERQPTRFSARGFKLLLEVLATQPGLRVAEVPITFVDRTWGASKLSPGELREFLVLCGRLWWWRLRQRRR